MHNAGLCTVSEPSSWRFGKLSACLMPLNCGVDVTVQQWCSSISPFQICQLLWSVLPSALLSPCPPCPGQLSSVGPGCCGLAVQEGWVPAHPAPRCCALLVPQSPLLPITSTLHKARLWLLLSFPTRFRDCHRGQDDPAEGPALPNTNAGAGVRLRGTPSSAPGLSRPIPAATRGGERSCVSSGPWHRVSHTVLPHCSDTPALPPPPSISGSSVS